MLALSHCCGLVLPVSYRSVLQRVSGVRGEKTTTGYGLLYVAASSSSTVLMMM